jgi:hypothetical protein
MVALAQRFTKTHPCPVCGGHADLPSGQGVRCFGFLSADGEYAHCTREELAGPLEAHPETQAFAHRLSGSCRCGVEHGSTRPSVPSVSATSTSQRLIVATYPYTDEAGELLYEVVRYEPKSFAQRRPDGNGSWVWNLDGTRRVPYKLPLLISAGKAGYPMWVVEGEKDADALEGVGILATCNPAGAGKWRAEYATYLRGAREVVVVADRDEQGHKHAAEVAASLSGIAPVRLVEAKAGKDAFDHLGAGFGPDEFVPLDKASPAAAPRGLGTSKAARLLDDILSFIRRFVVLSDDQACAVALWVVHTHAVDALGITPYVSITSAVKESGKTRLLEVFDVLVAKPWLTGSVSPAVLARKIDTVRPTLLLDESDATFKGDKEYAETLRGVLNTGFKSNGVYSRCEGNGAALAFRDFHTFCPKAIAGIGKLPDTIVSRSIPIRVKRKAPHEAVERWRDRKMGAEAEPLRKRIERWAEGHLDELSYLDLAPLSALRDRANDVWEPLLGIAYMAGEKWFDRARAAAISLSGAPQAGDEADDVRLLAAIRHVFATSDVERMSSTDLIRELASDDDSPWLEWWDGEKGKPAKGASRELYVPKRL